MTPETRPFNSTMPARILVIKLRHHGDMLLITPVIQTLRQRYPDAKIDVLLYEETRDMLAANTDIHRIYGIDRKWKKQGQRHLIAMEWGLLRTLRKQHYDLVLNLADQWRSAIVTRFTGAPRASVLISRNAATPFGAFAIPFWLPRRLITACIRSSKISPSLRHWV
jgi:heptosyltransferase-3